MKEKIPTFGHFIVKMWSAKDREKIENAMGKLKFT